MCGVAKILTNSIRSRAYRCPATEVMASIASLHRFIASGGGARDGDTTLQLILSKS